MRRTPCQLVLGFLFVILALAASAPPTRGQACAVTTLPQGRACSKPGARCSPPTVGGGTVGNCTTEAGKGDTFACECQGAPIPSYNLTVTPLTPSDLNTGVATSTITVVPFNGFTGEVHFICTITGMTQPAPSCALPPPANVTGSGSATAPLAVTVSDSTAQGTYTVTITAVDAHGRPPDNGAQSSAVSVSRLHWTIGNSLRAGIIVLLSFLVLLSIWGLGQLWRGKRAPSE